MSKIADAYLVYNLVKRLITPFEKWEAFKLGIIDKEGKVLKTRSELTAKEQDAWGYFDIAVANLKKILGKLPGGKTRLASYAAAMFLFKEQKNYTIDQLDQLAEDFIKQNEDVAVNNVQLGNIAGVGIGAQGEPPGKAAILKALLKRKKLNVGARTTT